MNEPFDPYRKWLGIPPEDQPPHHYRLLGIEPFESDPEVIVNAADGRMAQIKNFQIGKYAELSQQILNEIAAAKICLLNAEKKKHYDRKLRPRLEEERKGLPNAAPPAVRRPRPPASTTAETAVPAVETSSVFSYVSARSRQRRSWLVLVGLGLGAVALVVVSVVVLGRVHGPQVAQQPAPSGTRPEDRPPEGFQAPAPKNPDRPDGPPAIPETEEEQPPINPPIEPDTAPPATDPGRPLADLLDPPDPVPQGNHEAGGAESGGPARGLTPEGAATSAKRLPPPDDQARRKAEQRTREIFKRELAEAATPKEKLASAVKLADQAEKMAGDPAARFVLMYFACEKAAEAGALTAALDLADRLRQLYDLDVLTLKADLLDKVAAAMGSGTPASAASQQFADQARLLADEAVAGDNFDLAGRLAKLALSAARKVKDPTLLRRLEARDREIGRLKIRFVEVGKALDLLAENPADGQANLTTGRWYCFDGGNWAKGLPLLAKGADAGLAKLAEEDLAHPEDPKQQMRLADQWWNLAKKEKGPQQRGIQARAQHWYELALPGLTGLDKAEVERRLAELTAAAGPSGPGIHGVIRKGNVALASNGTTVTGIAARGSALIDGNTTQYDTKEGYALGACGGEWIITLPEVYQLREIRILLWDAAPRSYNYAITTSPDGKRYEPLVDRSNGNWSSWQYISFPPRPVKTIKFLPLRKFHTGRAVQPVPDFTVVELEAYCIPPKGR
jgi:hypothetical protein